jgi:hypothetical protein
LSAKRQGRDQLRRASASMWEIKNHVQKTPFGKKLIPGGELFGEEFTLDESLVQVSGGAT